jgi:hypothetical protein
MNIGLYNLVTVFAVPAQHPQDANSRFSIYGAFPLSRKIRNHDVKREDQQDATIRFLLLTSVSTCFGHHYAHLQEIKGPVTAFGVLFWFCWMWLVVVVGRCLARCEH